MREPVVLITGASQGIGAVLAATFARETDARLALMARSADKLKEVAAHCRDLGGEAVTIPCDVTDSDAIAEASARMHLDKSTPIDPKSGG